MRCDVPIKMPFPLSVLIIALSCKLFLLWVVVVVQGNARQGSRHEYDNMRKLLIAIGVLAGWNCNGKAGEIYHFQSGVMLKGV